MKSDLSGFEFGVLFAESLVKTKFAQFWGFVADAVTGVEFLLQFLTLHMAKKINKNTNQIPTFHAEYKLYL